MVHAHRARLTRYLALLHAFILAGFTLVVVAIALPPIDRDHLTAHLLLATGLAALAALTAIRGERAEHLALAMPLAGFGGLPVLTHPSDISGSLAFTACALLAVRTLGIRGYLLVVAATLGLMTLSRVVTGSEITTNNGASYLIAIAHTAVAGAFVRTLERSTEAMDAAEERSRVEQLRLVARRAQERAVAAARRVLHDDVLAALRLLADGDTAHDVRRVAGNAVTALDELVEGEARAMVDDQPGTGEPQDVLAGWVARMREESPIPFTTHVDIGELGGRGPASLAEAGHRAVLEALRNAHRHAGVQQAELSIVAGPTAVELVVRDDGPGMAEDAVEGVGIRESIKGAVASVGGHATVTSSPRGTEVRCHFPLPEQPRPDSLPRTYERTVSAGGQQRLVLSTMVPLGLAWLLVGARQVWRAEGTVPQLAMLVAAVAMVAVVTLRLRSRPPTAPWMLTVGGLLLGLQATGLALTPPGGMLDLRSWSVGFLATPLLILCFVLPVRWGAGLIVAHVALVLTAWQLEPALTAGRLPVSALDAVTLIPVLTLLLGMGLRRNTAVVEAARKQAIAASAELVHRRSLDQVSALHLDHTREVVVPWLRAVADGEVDPSVPEARAHARLLMHETRDDLHAPGFYDADLRAAVTAYRAGGGTVDIRPGFAPGAHARRIGVLVRELVERIPAGHRITVSPPAYDGAPARLVVVPRPPWGVVASLAPYARVERDEVAVVVEFEDRPVADRGSETREGSPERLAQARKELSGAVPAAQVAPPPANEASEVTPGGLR